MGSLGTGTHGHRGSSFKVVLKDSSAARNIPLPAISPDWTSLVCAGGWGKGEGWTMQGKWKFPKSEREQHRSLSLWAVCHDGFAWFRFIHTYIYIHCSGWCKGILDASTFENKIFVWFSRLAVSSFVNIWLGYLFSPSIVSGKKQFIWKY